MIRFDLSDGVWLLTLTCSHAYGLDACPDPVQASLTISGAGASAMSTTFNGEIFNGDPLDDLSTFSVYTAEESALINTPISELFVGNDTVAQPPPGEPDHGWGYCGHTDTGCQILFDGSWVATEVKTVSEPSTMALTALALLGLVSVHNRRRLRGA